ncbi:pggt1b [Trichonephila clavipes]|nr:pggt1b [Trichonephila clavipes]
MSKISPFAIHKTLIGTGCEPKSVKRLRSRDLLTETISDLQTKSFLLTKTFLNSPVTVSPHKTLNSSRGVISEPDLLSTPDAEILEGFSDQGVIQLPQTYVQATKPSPISVTTQTDENITKIKNQPLNLLCHHFHLLPNQIFHSLPLLLPNHPHPKYNTLAIHLFNITSTVSPTILFDAKENIKQQTSHTHCVVFQRVFAYHRSQYRMFSAIYTDGSKRADYVGCGVVIEDVTHGYRLDPSCGVFTAEAVAIYRALQSIDSNIPRKYCIYTDSMSVLEALESYNDRCHPVVCNVLDITSRLHSKSFDIVFCWLPSHIGIIGNEQADSAARSATTHLPLAVPLSDIKRVILHHIFKIWQEAWSLQLDNKLHSVKPVIGA